jgi:hypothetical protein
MKFKLFFVVSVLIIFLILSVSATAVVSLSNHGTNVKTIATGELLESGNLSISIWDSLNGGNLIYNETFLGVIINGSWSVMLGENSSNPLLLEYGEIYYYDYQVQGSDIDFTTYNGSTVDRQFFYSPLGDIQGEDINSSTNLTLGEKITFALGGIIDNIVNGWFRITGNLNVTGNVSADYFIGDGSQLTGVSGGGLVSSINLTSGTHTAAITNGSYAGYKAADVICDLEYPGSHFCTEFEVATWALRNIDGEDAWVIGGGPKFVPADSPVNDCNGWTHGTADTYLANYWHFNSTTGGDGRALHCGSTFKLACCTY